MWRIGIFLLVLAGCHALWEIEIEGSDGWACKLPTWRRNPIWRVLLGGKPLTGYHFWMFIMLGLGFHSPYFFTVWSISSECLTFATLFTYLVVEDILWFILNPAYTLSKFISRDVSWHRDWFGPFPTCYWFAFLLSSLCVYISFLVK